MSTAKVSYAYASGSANTVRRTGATYPNGRQVGYLCDYPAGDKLSRISSIIEGAPADGLRAFWKLDEDVSSGSRSDSADANTLADSSSNVGTGTGLFGGKAAKLTLSPTSVLALGATPNLSFGKQDFTTSGWIKFNSFSATDSTTGVWGKGNAGNANPLVEEWTLYVLNSNKHLHWLLSNGSTYVDVDLNVVLTTGTWYFICAWYDATLERAYVQVNTTSTYQSYTAGPSDQGYGFTVGRTVDHYLDGLVQNIGVWDRLLTSAEKTALYNSGSGVKFYNQARYSYLGTSAPVIVDYATPQVQYTLATGSGASLYAGLDRFGRVIDCRWQTLASSPTDVARLKYGYDRASNRTYREDPVAKAQSTPKYFDELYAYDGLYRLTGMQRGQLTGTPPSGITNKNFAQGWTLDPTGNWQGFTEAATGGSNTLVQTRTANPANEITDITNTTGSAWSQAGYDAAGNMVAIPKPATPTEGFTGVYDAWNRLVRVLDADTNATVQENAYDGLTRRTVQKTYSSGTLSETRHYYYSDAWQVLEERLGTSPDSAAADRQFVWGLRYIDDLVLRDRSVSGGTLNERLYALQDANWNVVAICNTSGTVQERFAYSPYGVPLFLTAAFVAHSSAFNWETLFCGYRHDVSTGLYLVRYRPLNSVLGGWVTRDPSRFDLANAFRYVNNNATSMFDPLGLEPTIDPGHVEANRLGTSFSSEQGDIRGDFQIDASRTSQLKSVSDFVPNAVNPKVIRDEYVGVLTYFSDKQKGQRGSNNGNRKWITAIEFSTFFRHNLLTGVRTHLDVKNQNKWFLDEYHNQTTSQQNLIYPTAGTILFDFPGVATTTQTAGVEEVMQRNFAVAIISVCQANKEAQKSPDSVFYYSVLTVFEGDKTATVRVWPYRLPGVGTVDDWSKLTPSPQKESKAANLTWVDKLNCK